MQKEHSTKPNINSWHNSHQTWNRRELPLWTTYIELDMMVWTQNLELARQALYHLSHNPTITALVTFQIGSATFCPQMTLDLHSSTSAFHVTGITGANPHIQLGFWDKVSLIFFVQAGFKPQSSISTSCIAGINLMLNGKIMCIFFLILRAIKDVCLHHFHLSLYWSY
jgi:hypothetical protein